MCLHSLHRSPTRPLRPVERSCTSSSSPSEELGPDADARRFAMVNGDDAPVAASCFAVPGDLVSDDWVDSGSAPLASAAAGSLTCCLKKTSGPLRVRRVPFRKAHVAP